MTSRQKMVWGTLILALALAAGSAVAEGGFRRYIRLTQDVNQLKERNARLTQHNAQLRREMEALHGDKLAIERAAREELGFVRPGEIVFSLEKP